MGWNPLQLPLDAIAAVTTVAAVVLYGYASRLPLPFPMVMRLMCVWLLITSTTLLAMTGKDWWHAVVLGGAGLAAIVIIYLLQTRRKTAPVKEANGKAAEKASADKLS
jgi:hypothetical protein